MVFPGEDFRLPDQTEARVVEYKLYFLDTEGRIRQRIDLECALDQHAVERATSLADRRAMELWRGSNLIEQFPAKADSATS
jgi:hypothetical protein